MERPNRVGGLADLQLLINTRGEERGVRVRLEKRLASLGEANQVVRMLKEKVRRRKWVVLNFDSIMPLKRIGDALDTAGDLIGQLIVLTDQAAIVRPGSPTRSVNVAPLVRIAGFASPPSSSTSHLHMVQSSSAARRRRNRARRRSTTPRYVSAKLPKQLLEVGKVLEMVWCLSPVTQLGDAIQEVAMSIIRLDKDRPTANASLRQLQERLHLVRASPVRIKELKPQFGYRASNTPTPFSR